MAIYRITSTLVLPQPYAHRGYVSAAVFGHDDKPEFPLHLSIQAGAADVGVDLSLDSARLLRDLIDAGLASLEAPDAQAQLSLDDTATTGKTANYGGTA